ncbi:MAG: alpha/beta hydrolase [Phaeodactylibacter sp.]|uniref:alpha/beta hydrolase n=1 Tax=Phaeodactylibacter sp. TaxID=1940289 RepID=UPI0032EBFCBC
MQKRTFFWTTADGIRIHACEWKTGDPRAVICIAHGLGEHIERYEHMARWFNARGFSVFGYDRRGHGQSGGKRGHSPGLDPLLDEIAQLLVEARTDYQNLPVFLYGHSQGGGLVLSYALRRHPQVTGVIASGPWIQLSFTPPSALVALGRLMRNLYPGFLQPNNLDPKLLSRDSKVVEAYEKDPLVHNRISAAVGIDMMQEGDWIMQQKGGFPVPLLIVHGDADGVTSAEASEAFAGQLEGDITFKSWPGMYHELHNEPEKVAVFEYVLNWLERLV